MNRLQEITLHFRAMKQKLKTAQTLQKTDHMPCTEIILLLFSLEKIKRASENSQ